MAVGIFMATLDGSIVNVALPSIRLGLSATIGGVELVVTVYLLVISAALLGAGRLGDLFGHRRVYVAGLLLFTLGSGLCGVSGSLPALVASRAVQALGASATTAMAPAVVTALFPPEMRGRALGGITSVVAVGLTAGPPLGGFILQYFSWPAIFLVNLPVGVAGAVWASRMLPGGAMAAGVHFDRAGAVLFGLVVAGLVGSVEVAPSSAAAALGLVLLAAAAGALLWRVERRALSPVLDPALLRDRVFGFGLAAGLLSYAAMFSQAFLTPFWLTREKGLDARGLGLMLTAVPLALSAVSLVAGWLSDRVGPRLPCLVGAGVLAAGLWSLAGAGPGDSLASVAARLAALGAGMGLFQPPNNSAVMGSLPRQRLGTGGGMLATARNLGMVVGVSLAGALLAVGAGQAGGEAGAGFLAGWRLALLAGAALAVAAGLFSLVRSEARAAGPGSEQVTDPKAPGAA
ncbi:MAG TPA: MFS transporter [Anaeromyxobacteraceae bacterium]|nr:MFS transporter [Anaeromyxobacteraceae bacterium]